VTLERPGRRFPRGSMGTRDEGSGFRRVGVPADRKNDPSRALQEMADIQRLLELPKIDEDEVRRYFERHGLIEAFHEIKRRSGSA
jgi:hypothetical protein